MSENQETKKKSIFKKWWFWLIIIVLVIAIAGSQGTNTNTTNTASPSTTNNSKITLEEFNQIQTGMTYEQVVEIIGAEGTIMSEADVTGDEQYKTTIYSWDGEGSLGANANVTFQGGKVISKAQFGLE